MRRTQIAGVAKDTPADGRMTFRDLITFESDLAMETTTP